MKIATLTFHKAVNYGAVLQAYALYTALKTESDDVGILDYYNEAIEAKFHPLYVPKKKGVKKQIKAFVKMIVSFKMKYRRIKKFNVFLKKRTALIPYRSRIECKEANKEIDIIMVGSDQVWNFDITGYDSFYYLDSHWKDTFKCSYAASFGKTEINDEEKKAVKSVEGFQKISVREKSAKKLLYEVIDYNVDIEVVPDPVFLLTREEWRKIESPIKKLMKIGEYILIYHFNASRELFDFARKLSKKYNAKIVVIQGSLLKHEGCIVLNDIGPEEFLWVLDNAKCIVTNSFHGTAFSIIFGKEFYSEVNFSRGTRIRELLIEYGLNSQGMVDGVLQANENCIHDEVDEILNNKRLVGKKYINSVVKEYNKMKEKE